LAGGECPRASQGGTQTQAEEEGSSASSTQVVQESQEMIVTTVGFMPEELDQFTWLIDFVEENKMSCEIWFNKLVFYYVDGVQVKRRLLRKDEIPKFK